MKTFQKIFLGLLLVIFLSILVGGFCLAQRKLETIYPTVPGVQTPMTTKTALPDYLRYVFTFAIIISGIIAFVAMIYGGFLYLTSAGDPTKLSNAKDQVIASFLGLIIILSSFLILNTINPQLVLPSQPMLEAPIGGIRIYANSNDCGETPTPGKESQDINEFLISQSYPALYATKDSAVILNWGAEGTYKISSIKFLSEPRDLTIEFFSQNDYLSSIIKYDESNYRKGDCLIYTGTQPRSVKLDYHYPGVYLYANLNCEGDKYGTDYVIYQASSATLQEFNNKTKSIKFIYDSKGETKFAAILHEKENYMGEAALFDQDQNSCLNLSAAVALNSSPNILSKSSNLAGISSCEAAGVVYPHIDSIDPVSAAAETAFTLKVDGINFNSEPSKNIVQFRDVPWTPTKQKTAKSGSSTHLEFDIPSNFFAPTDAGKEWRVYVSSYYYGAYFDSDNYKDFNVTATKTCEQLGGECCPSGKVCSIGKKSGASDCAECCAYIGNCEETSIYPHIDSISPTEAAAETAFELTVTGSNFNSDYSKNKVQFEQPGIATKERYAKSGNSNELKFDIPANFFAPGDAGNWEVWISSQYQTTWFLSENYKSFTVGPSTKTCEQLGGECCPSGKVCSIGKKSGASDCAECCAYIENCGSPTCSWQDDKCGQSPCSSTQRHQTCGPPGCTGGSCTAGNTRCISDAACVTPSPPSPPSPPPAGGGAYGADLTGRVSSITVYLKPVGKPFGQGVRFYENKNYTMYDESDSCKEKKPPPVFGDGQMVNDMDDLTYCTDNCDAGCNDKISSMEMDGHYVALLFRDPDYRGDAEVFTESKPDFRPFRIGQCGWLGRGDCLSSFIIKARK